MTPTGIRNSEAEAAAIEPPASLSAFILTAISPIPGSETLHWVDYAVACKACGQDTFHLGWFPLSAPNPSPYFEVLPGETIKRPPHRLRCSQCAKVETIFDARTDGYDGLLNGGCAYESGESNETFTSRPYSIVVSAVYNIELSELVDLDRDAGKIKATDLFDALKIIATQVVGGDVIELNYECA